MRKSFLLRLICVLVTAVRAVMIYLPFGWWNLVYSTEDSTCPNLRYFSHMAENYRIIIFFCICIIFCSFRNKMKWMWMFSTGLLLSDALIRRIDHLERLTLPMNWHDVVEYNFTPSPYVTLLPICCWVIFILSFVLFIWQRREEQRLAVLKEEAVLLEKEAWEEKVNERF